MEILFEIKSKLASIGVELSDNKFSRVMLSKSSRYISWMRATGHEPALDCMVSLYTRLDDLNERFEQSGNTKSAKMVNEMAETLWDAIRNASLTQVPKRRPSTERRSPPKDAAQAGASVALSPTIALDGHDRGLVGKPMLGTSNVISETFRR